MDERRFIELLQLVDEPGDEAAEDFKRRLRLELDKTLHHEALGSTPPNVVRLAPAEEDRSQSRRSWLLVAAAVIAVVIAAAAVVSYRDEPGLAPADQPVPVTTMFTTTTIAVLTDADAACARYVDGAELLTVLTSFTRDQSGSPPDFAATEAALRQLALDANAGGFATTESFDSLELAAGALAEAGREAAAGELASASAATQVAVLSLTDVVQVGALAVCFP